MLTTSEIKVMGVRKESVSPRIQFNSSRRVHWSASAAGFELKPNQIRGGVQPLSIIPHRYERGSPQEALRREFHCMLKIFAVPYVCFGARIPAQK